MSFNRYMSMKLLKYIFIAFAMTLFVTSCSRDDLADSRGGKGAVKSYTFTVTPDVEARSGMLPRSAGTAEERPTRCFMQILGNSVTSDVQAGVPDGDGAFTFSVQLPSNTILIFLFWADNSNDETPADLREVQYKPGTVAFAARVEATPEYVFSNGVSLVHAVTKLTLQTTTDVTAKANSAVRATTMCAGSYNVNDPDASEFSLQTAEKTFETATGFAANQEVATFYFIPEVNPQDVNVEFNALQQSFSEVPLAANSHVTLQGDLSEDNPKWGATSKYVEEQIKHFFTNEDGNSKGTPGTNGYYFYLPESDIDKFESVIGAILHEEVEISLDGFGTILEKEFEDDYIFSIRNDIYSEILTIYIGYTPVYNICYSPYNTNYDNFSIVSDVLEQSTD